MTVMSLKRLDVRTYQNTVDGKYVYPLTGILFFGSFKILDMFWVL